MVVAEPAAAAAEAVRGKDLVAVPSDDLVPRAAGDALESLVHEKDVAIGVVDDDPVVEHVGETLQPAALEPKRGEGAVVEEPLDPGAEIVAQDAKGGLQLALVLRSPGGIGNLPPEQDRHAAEKTLSFLLEGGNGRPAERAGLLPQRDHHVEAVGIEVGEPRRPVGSDVIPGVAHRLDSRGMQGPLGDPRAEHIEPVLRHGLEKRPGHGTAA